jgi:hypothetical protein
MENILDSYPSPKPNNEKYTEYWNMYLRDIGDRENLKPSHVTQLKILCSLCIEYDELQEILELEGRTYESMGRNGLQIKLKPEVQLIKSCIAEIRNYSKMLDLVLSKDQTMTNGDKENNEFK